MDYIIVLYRTILFYVIITLIYRFMGKREIGQLSIVDLIVSMLIAELAAISIDNKDESVFLSIIPIIGLTLIQIIMAQISLKSAKIRSVFDGSPSIIINRGKINFKEMIRQRYNIDDLLTQLRDKNIRTIEEVDYAVLETSGKLSVFKKDAKLFGEYPLPLILDGIIDEDVLTQIGKDKSWVIKTLNNEHITLEEVFYGFYRNKKIFIIKKDLFN